MTAMMSQPGLAAPASRQDIISALLNDYGNSFGDDPSSLNNYSSDPALKELPPPPPKIETPHSAHTMKFPLRVDEPQSPSSPERKESPTRIVYQSMSRNSKPPSLKLTKSNGATAIIPQGSAPPAAAKDTNPSSQPAEERPLPPPPPPKSDLRKPSMGNEASRPERRDSKEPQDSRPVEAPPVKRKPVPIAKGFSLADLGAGPRGRKPAANEQDTPRPSAARLENETPAPHASSAYRANSSKQELPAPPTHQDKAEAALPPPPPPEKIQVVLTPAPRKPVGLPSNPRNRGQATPNGEHSLGKSATGLDLMKVASHTSSEAISPRPAATPTPILAPPLLSTMTPDPTPSPGKTEAIQTGAAVQGASLANTIQAALHSPVSSIEDHDDYSRRPFSFEAPPAPKSAPTPAAPVQSVSSIPPPTQNTQLLPRSASRPEGPDSDSRAEQRPMQTPQDFVPQSQPQLPPQNQQPFQAPQTPTKPFQQPPAPQLRSPQEDPFSSSPILPNHPPAPQSHSSFTSPSSSPPSSRSSSPAPATRHALFPIPYSPSTPFVPLTKQPIPTPAAPITATHLNCYTSHAVLTRYTARYQPPGCMVCHASAPGVRATCACCFLVVCGDCDMGLRGAAGRRLSVVLRKREEREGSDGDGGSVSDKRDDAVPLVVVSDEGEGEDFS